MSERSWWMTPSGVLVPEKSVAAPVSAKTRRPAFKHIESYLCASEFAGAPFPMGYITADIRRFGRIPTFGLLAALAAEVANHGAKSRRVRELTVDALVAVGQGVNPHVQRTADWVRANPHRAIAHERVLYWLQSLALVECDDGDAEPSMAALSWLMLLANDHLDDGRSAEPLPSLDRILANFAFESRFNVGGDSAAAMVRSYELTHTPPQGGPLAADGAWEALMREAFFGISYHDYFVEVLGPLVVLSGLWGVPAQGRTDTELPVIHAAEFYARARMRPAVADEVLAALSVSVTDARAQILKERSEGGGRLPTVFVERPFLRLDDGRLVLASPSLLREQMRLGAWDRCRRAARRRYGDRVWNPAFGESFEKWARALAERASRSPAFAPTLVLSPRLGDQQEIEDVVLVDRGRVALISAKARLIPGDVAGGASRRGDAVRWYESFLFDEARGAHRGGAIRLLHDAVGRLRAGRGQAQGVPEDARVYPVLLTYERLCEGPVLYAWVRERCRQLGLLDDANMGAVTFLSAAEYEHFLAAAASGLDVFDLLDKRGDTDDGLVPFEQVLAEVANPKMSLRVPGVDEIYEGLMDETCLRLFGRTMSGAAVENDRDVGSRPS